MAKTSVAEREAPPVSQQFWAKRSFGYGGLSLDRGQVFLIKGLANDGLLRDLGYMAPVVKGASTYACRVCGAEFIDMKMRDGHGKSRHESRPYVPPTPPERQPGESKDVYQNRLDQWAQAAGAAADAAAERQDRMENEVAPLDLTKTRASRT